ncbi:DUF3999 family protein [Denitromonas halophila]|uniref:DUF3999 domain-containing protein n=1 Tax=Denitromonas halophila TaxID=1629404 RepID=A0A557QXT0_9RHOO|nr:DUF3999 family protein [Denitromonas halophila]TVO57646.1 DUF3999 domain-containing protein [Denitromonas halophila]
MKTLPWLLMAMAPLALAAPGVEDFDVRLSIEAPVDASLLQLNLPADVYRAVRHADLRDVRIFNATGEAVPMARLPRPTESQALRVERPLVALPARSAPVRDGVTVHASGATSVRVEVDRTAPAAVSALPGYLLEVKDFDAAVDELTLIWPEATPFEAVVSVQASDDLQQWRTVAHRRALLSLGEGEARIVQDRIALPAVRSRYLRVDWVGTPPPVTLQRAALVSSGRAVSVAREWVELSGQVDARTIDFSSPGLFPVDALRLVPVSDSDVISARVASRAAVSGRWQWRARTVGYRLQQAGGVDEGEATTIAPTRDPLWRVTLDADATEVPRLALGWTPESVAFVARGAGPYTLAVGHASAPSVWQAPGQVVPGFGTDRAAALASARVRAGAAPVAAAPREPAPWQAGSHWWLWGALLLGVGVLGAMARGLWREMGTAKDTPTK